MRSHKQGLLRLLLLPAAGSVLLLAIGVAHTMAGDEQKADSTRFRRLGQTFDRTADWVTIDGNRVAFGSGQDLYLGEHGSLMLPRSEFKLDAPISEAVLVQTDLYLNDNRSISVLDLRSPQVRPVPVRLDPAPQATLHLSRMTDYLVVAEDGVGLRFVALPLPSGHRSQAGHRHHFPSEATQIAFLPLKEKFRAIATSGHRVYAAIEGKRIALIDAGGAANPNSVRYLPMKEDVHALAANGATLYLLGSGGLRVMDLSVEDGPSITRVFPEVQGRSIQLAGRSVYVAGGDRGVTNYNDSSALAAIQVINVGDIFFSPTSVTINEGDTVKWQKPGTSFRHNVLSCNSAQFGCDGATSTEAFTSGRATTSPFTFQYRFTTPGDNPYVCQIHTVNMRGTVVVRAAVVPAGRVPDGAQVPGTPLTVEQATGGQLRLTWGDSCLPTDNDFEIYEGTLGAFYSHTMKFCTTSGATTSTFLPGPGSTYYVVVPRNGPREGSYGINSNAVERPPGVPACLAQEIAVCP